MALSVVNHISAFANTAQSVTTSALSITPGNLLIVAINNQAVLTAANNDASPAVTDTAGNTYVKAEPASISVQYNRYYSLWYVANCLGGGSVTFTYSLTGPNTNTDIPQILVMQVAGAATSSPLDQHTEVQLDGGFGTKTTSAITTTRADELVVLYSINGGSSAGATTWADGGAANSLGTPTLIEDTGAGETATQGGTLAYAIVSSTGTYAGTASVALGNQWQEVGIASFNAAAATGLPPGLGPVVGMTQPLLTDMSLMR